MFDAEPSSPPNSAAGMDQAPDGDGPRMLAIAVDAPGGRGPRTYTYVAPAALGILEPGEVVLVPFGKGGRQALGIVVGEGSAPDDAEVRPVAARVRSDGPIVPTLTLALAVRVADHYLAPLSMVLRAMLPPGMLERLELVVEASPAREAAVGWLTPADADLLEEVTARPRPVRDLSTPDGRAGLLRRLRALETAGFVELTWTLLSAAAGPRYERRLWPTAAGVEAARLLAAGERTPGRQLGPRQTAALAELATDTAPDAAEGMQASLLADRQGASGVAGLVRRGLVRVAVQERPRRPLAARPPGLRGTRPQGASLTAEQARAVAIVAAAIAGRDATPTLLDGVTGGGKTAIYVEAIAASLDLGRPALLLVPEIALATPITDRLRSDLGVRVSLVHSGLSEGERADEWRRIRAGDTDLVVGTRTAVLAPLADVGLIIVDEEHDPAYKSDRTPRFQARDVAMVLAALAGAAVVLGSATPSVETVGHARSGRYRRAELPTRPSGAAPMVMAVDLRAELQAGNRGLLSDALTEALSGLDTQAGERAILVINRRGTASVVMCRDCGDVQACPDCDRPLVFHQAGGTLRCHHCGRAWPLASRCPECSSPRIRYLGGGTERVEREVRERFPGLRVGRLDRDVVERRGAADRVLDGFAEGRLDVLVGTSLVAKGLDIPEVTLVGVVSADIALNLPDERAAERTYQLLAQAVGRAGRGHLPGTAIVQTYRPEHRAIRAVVDGDRDAFYDEELDLRRRFGSPPFGKLVKLTLGLPDREAAEAAAFAMAESLRDRARDRALPVVVAGPAPAYVARRAERWRYNVVLRGADPGALLDPPPVSPWSVDVDPESLL